MNNIRVCYINYLGKNTDGLNVYQFMFTDTPDNVFCDGWSEKPACNISNEVLIPEEDMYQYVAEVRTDLVFDLAQNNCCFSMQDCRDNIVALASENLDSAEEYPDDGRIVIHFGDSFADIEEILENRDIKIKFV